MRQAFKCISDVSEYLNGSIYSSSHNFIIGLCLELVVTLSYGAPDSYHEDSQIVSFSPSDLLFRVVSVSVKRPYLNVSPNQSQHHRESKQLVYEVNVPKYFWKFCGLYSGTLTERSGLFQE